MELVRSFNSRRRKLRRVPEQDVRSYSSQGYATTPKESWVLGRWSMHADNILYLGGNTGMVGIVDVEKAYDDNDHYAGIQNDYKNRTYPAFPAHSSLIIDLSGVPGKSEQLVTVSGDTTVRLWDLNKDSPLSTLFLGHDKSVRSISFCPDNSNVFVTSSRDGSILRWDTRESQRNKSRCREPYIQPVATYSNAHNIMKDTVLTPRRRKTTVPKMNVEPTSVTCVQYVDDKTIVTGSQSARTGLRVWDMRKTQLRKEHEGTPIMTYQLPNVDKGVTNLCLDRFKSSIFAAVTDSIVYEFPLQAKSTKPVRSFSGAQISSFYMQIASCPDADFLICGSKDGSAVLWNLQPYHSYLDDSPIALGECSKSLKSISPKWRMGGHDSEVCSVGWSKDGNYIFTLDDSEWRLWDRKTIFVPEDERRDDGHQNTAGFEQIQPFIQRITDRTANSMDRVSLTPKTPARVYLSPTKSPRITGAKRKLAFPSPFKDMKTPQKSPRSKQRRLEFDSPILPLSENSSLLNSPSSTYSKSPSKRVRRPRNAFQARYPTENLPAFRYEWHLQRLRQNELEKCGHIDPSTQDENNSTPTRSVEDWLRKVDTPGKAARLTRMRVPSLSEFGESACSLMVTEQERVESHSPRKLVIRAPAHTDTQQEQISSTGKVNRSTSNKMTPRRATLSSTVNRSTPNKVTPRPATRNIMDYFPKTPKTPK